RQEARKLPLGRHAEPLPRVEEHDEGVEQGLPGRGGQLRHPKRQSAGRGAVRGIHQTNVAAVGKDPDRHVYVPQEAIELRGRRIVPFSSRGFALIERKPRRHVPEKRDRLRGWSANERLRGAERLAGVRHVERESRRERTACDPTVRPQFEDVGEKGGKIGDPLLAGRKQVEMLTQAREKGLVAWTRD